MPVHFATDAWGLADYDGTALFEYPDAEGAALPCDEHGVTVDLPPCSGVLIGL